jgi:hypothetical protein
MPLSALSNPTGLDKTPPQDTPLFEQRSPNTSQNIEIKEFTTKISEINILRPHPDRNLLIPKI